MAWKGGSSAAYTGSSGQMAVMSELFHRKCNVAIPQIDVGIDVFAFRDNSDLIARIQVKTALGKRHAKGDGFSAKFGVPLNQLRSGDEPPLYYAFAIRFDESWGPFLILSRTRIIELLGADCGTRTETSGNLEMSIRFRPAVRGIIARCGNFDFSSHIDDWQILPPIKSTLPAGSHSSDRAEPGGPRSGADHP